MKLVIDIPEETYNKIHSLKYLIYGLKSEENRQLFYQLINTIQDGTLLPKRHGRLINADELKRTMENDPRKALSFVDLTDFIWLAPTIIERSDSK